ncbi:MAG: tRNA pseudouridine(55) synthase TruB [Syntrophobacterales bacterium]|nr:tRNA pseudouridine(55) synthase TruB [Syntrophobacterales bacterium]
MNGVVVVDKPAGITSHDAVDRVRRILGERKAGHTGTLDPMATGVLPVCVGEATKLASFLAADDKVYEVTMRLGVRTDTLDMTGRVLGEQEPRVTGEEIRAVLEGFAGTITQVPPQYSAVKVRGRALYKWARKGVQLSPPARQVEIRAIRLRAVEMPRVRFDVTCSKGTYVRTLCADMGERLGCGAALESLRRTASGRFRLEDAVSLEGASDAAVRERLERALIPPARALAGMGEIPVPPHVEEQLRKGHQPDAGALAGLQIPSLAAGDVVKFTGGSGRLVALARMVVATADIPMLGARDRVARILRVFIES